MDRSIARIREPEVRSTENIQIETEPRIRGWKADKIVDHIRCAQEVWRMWSWSPTGKERRWSRSDIHRMVEN